MNEFIRFFDDLTHNSNPYRWNLEIYYSAVMDWCITIKNERDEILIDVQHCDVDLAFAKAQVEFKEWLLKNEGGY